jgi:hypothetical protein
MKKLLLLTLVLASCSPTQVENTQEQVATQDGAIAFRFRGKNHVMKYANNIDEAVCIYTGSLTPNTDKIMVSGAEYTTLNEYTFIDILKIAGITRIKTSDFYNGNTINTYVPNAIITITAQTQEYTSFTFKGDGIQNGVGTKVPNKYVN